ncbi:unnamed protein product [Eruca vesicaria subsp. sativa]|uniref:Uncharacterized protein n=1 Tax=Eruca vesicaria subsp. sativa TaxID=29727 RepID=A0ABC8IZQ6_ERUVS|nr:unnamed protein product [Eruca vesicaria subsp. sativa]
MPRISSSYQLLIFLCQEKREYQKVRVRHTVVKPIEDRNLKWKDNKVFTDLDNMIQDILNDQLDKRFWEVMANSTSNKRKVHISPPLVQDTNDVEAHNMDILGLAESVQNLTGKLDGINACVAEKVIAKLDAAIQAKVDPRIGLYESESNKKISMLEEEIKNLKQKHGVFIPTEVANSNGGNSIAQ